MLGLLYSCARIIFTGFALWKLLRKTCFFTGCRLSIRRLLVGELAGCCLPVTLDSDPASVSRRWTKCCAVERTVPHVTIRAVCRSALVIVWRAWHGVSSRLHACESVKAVTARRRLLRFLQDVSTLLRVFFCPSWWGVSHSYLDSSGCGSIVNFWPVYRDQ